LQPPFYFDVEEADAVEYIKAGKAEGRALFFSWPSNVMACLEYYTGDTVFRIGEECTQRMPYSNRDWVEVHRMEVPQWLCLHDKFVVYKRRSTVS
jgi:hypothetical protein